ncbi:MAG: N-acyl-D-amino-acid deacylase family protein [Acidimicrobiales bacterium]
MVTARSTSAADYDIVIRGGTVIDGSGLESRRADVAVSGDRITAVGTVAGHGREELDASGLVVAPGFVDAHTHMDAQIFWDDLGMPACWHGVTTAVMGNCGFTLAPVRREEHALVVRNLERAEDISAEALAAGLVWRWETFAQYLDAVDSAAKGLNYAASVGHSALRTWAMGERAFDGAATDADLARMQAELRSALTAGAAGFTTSRSIAHATSDDRPVASRLASWSEVEALVQIVGDSGAVFQLAPERLRDERANADFEDRLCHLTTTSRAATVFGLFANSLPGTSIDLIEKTAAQGGEIYGLTHCRGILSAQSFLTRLGFDNLAEWHDVRRRSLDEQQALLRNPEVRRRLVQSAHHGDYGKSFGPEAGRPNFESMRILRDPVLPNPTVAEEARARRVDPVEAMIDIALEQNLNVFFLQELVAQEDDQLIALMRHPRTAMGFSDSGAHVSQIFDSSIYSHLLAYWVRERQELTLEEAIAMITSRPAHIWRLRDRGRLSEGFAADVTIFDPATVAPTMPTVVTDLPAGAKRIEQRSTGYIATIVNGQFLTRGGDATSNRAGRLLRASNQRQHPSSRR